MPGACLFCEAFVMSGEQHHFPVPKRHGGTETHLVCNNCHDLADRHSLGKMPLTQTIGSFASLWAKADANERVMLWRMHALHLDALAELEKKS